MTEGLTAFKGLGDLNFEFWEKRKIVIFEFD